MPRKQRFRPSRKPKLEVLQGQAAPEQDLKDEKQRYSPDVIEDDHDGRRSE